MQRQPSLAASDVGSEHSDVPLMAQQLPRTSSPADVQRASAGPGAAVMVVAVEKSAADVAAIAARRRTSLLRRSTLAVAAVRLVSKARLSPAQTLCLVS